jgi:hypothetical protein
MHFIPVDMYQPTLCPICQWHSFLALFDIAMMEKNNSKIERDDPEMGISHVNRGNVLLCIVREGGGRGVLNLLTEFDNPWCKILAITHAIPYHFDEESEGDPADDFVLRNAQGRLVYIRHALHVLESKWGAVDTWPSSFGQEWLKISAKEAHEVASWCHSIRIQVQTGWRLIGYITRVMDGEMPTVEEWRNLWLECCQLLKIMYTSILGLEHKLDLVERYGIANMDCIQFEI